MTSHLPCILAVDDDASVISSLKIVFDGSYQFVSAANGKETMEALNKFNIQLVILDIGLPDIRGTEVLKKVKEFNPAIEVVMLTADNSAASGVEAMKLGAFDYLIKPFDVDQMFIVVKNAIERMQLLNEVRYRRMQEADRPKVLIGQSQAMRDVLSLIDKLANNDATALIIGESGTGKELVANAIHNASDRREGPFVAVNCVAIPKDLIESELFGHEKGSFTSAASRRLGKFEIAHRGTIFLDELSALPIELQGKLLRVLQERVIERVGAMRPLPVDVRIIAATNVDLKEMIKKGQFREDLYYRVNVVPVVVPPLRQRREDIPLLVQHFLDIYNKQFHRRIDKISLEVMEYLKDYYWPGNIRELENVIQRLLVISQNPEISVDELPLEVLNAKSVLELMDDKHLNLEKALDRFEQEYIKNILIKTKNCRQEAAELLGIHRNTLANKIKSLGLDNVVGEETE
ncbi:MAG: sigma-54 dependent transcriptional regulator [Candidatus Brocadiia bacterium]